MRLSICIPTYNRIGFLETFVTFLICEIKAHRLESEIELLISNNNSSDGTLEYVNKLESVYDDINFKIINNLENIGVVKNIINCVNHAKGDYWWFIGDDDFVLKDVLPKIISHLQNYHSIPVHIFNQEHNRPINYSESITIEEAIKKYLYFIGNAITIADTRLSKKIISSELNETAATCWPHTYIYFRICYLSNIPKPVFVNKLVIFCHQQRIINNVTNSYYHFDAQFFSLLKIGYMLDKKNKNLNKVSNFSHKGVKFLNFPQIFEFAFHLEFKNRFSDLANEIDDYEKTIEDARKILKSNHVYLLNIILFFRKFPTSFFKIVHLTRTVSYFFLHQLLIKKKLANPFTILNQEIRLINNLKKSKIDLIKLKHVHYVLRDSW